MQVYVRELRQEGFSFIVTIDFIETPTVVSKEYVYPVGNKNSIIDAVTKDAKEVSETIALALEIFTNYVGNTYTYNKELGVLE